MTVENAIKNIEKYSNEVDFKFNDYLKFAKETGCISSMLASLSKRGVDIENTQDKKDFDLLEQLWRAEVVDWVTGKEETVSIQYESGLLNVSFWSSKKYGFNELKEKMSELLEYYFDENSGKAPKDLKELLYFYLDDDDFRKTLRLISVKDDIARYNLTVGNLF